MKRIFLALFVLALIHCEIGDAQSTDFPNVLDAGQVQVICKSAVAVSAPADTNEDTLATCAVPAKAMGPNGKLRITSWWSTTSSGNNKSLRVRWDGASGNQYLSNVITVATDTVAISEIVNRGATNSQYGNNFAVFSNGTVGVRGAITSAVDTTAATSVVFTGQKASSGETITLESYVVELLPGR